MLLETYNSKGLLSITSVLGATSEQDKFAFRGDLILKLGELREGSDVDRKPPEFLINQAILLASSEKLLFVGGMLNELSTLSIFVEEFKTDLTADTVFVLYVENIAESLKVEYEGLTFQLLPYEEGMVWNEFLELFYIEKSDLKGQSAEDKVITVFDEAKSFDNKAAVIGYSEALDKTIEVDKDLAVGPV